MQLDPKSQEGFESYAEYQRETLDRALEMTLCALEQCGSPLERKLLLYYLSLNGGCTNMRQADDDWHYIFVFENQYDGFTLVEPQYPIKIDGHNYRADFLFTYKSRYPLTTRVRLVVEVDGHDFHERTKEQAMRDKFRDRLMLREGFVVMRFTGSEVFRETWRVVDEINSYLRRAEESVAEQRGVFTNE